ncbi:MAG: redoxin domain-containing protein [Bacteroidales bacterium]|nr:redoxin domain-containing protein [Bacteroidales bacterium]
MLKKILFLSFVSGLFFNSNAQNSDEYKIEIKIKHTQDTVLYLANYYGDKTYLADTALLKGKDTFVFQKDEELGGGLYIIVNQEKRSIFEFLVSDSRDMKFETLDKSFVENMKVHHSDENVLFYKYLSFSSQLYEKVKPLNEALKRLGPDADSSIIIREELKIANQEMADYKEGIMTDYPETFLASFFGLIKDASVPDTLLTFPDGSKDSAYPYRYYKAHYWDYIHLEDERLIRTPIFHKKLDTYFDQVIGKDADTIISEIDHLLAQMDETGELYKFSLWHLTIKYDESQIMGHDAILVHMSDQYFSKGKASWLHEGVVKNILDEADKRRSTLIGQKAPNLIMQDTNLKPISLYKLKNEYIVLYFWDPQCGHCKKETPQLVDFYNNFSKELDVEVYAVCADTNMLEMKKYIKSKKMSFINVNGPRSYVNDYHDLYNIFSTPVIIVMDKNRNIIAKRLVSEQLPDFLRNHKKYSVEKGE